jgi:Alw26I/Eco31I/Esp3I family type II restriction endonuclease
MEYDNIIDDPSLYGSKGQSWSKEFVTYMKKIVINPAYKGMPDAIKSDGKIQWEAPSNRSSGVYQFTHNKRRDWWKSKAKSLGIDVSKDQWISRTAKSIHPTGKKPCKRCGTVMQIAYIYPQASMIKRLKKHFDEALEFSPLDPITDILDRLYNLYGDQIFQKIKLLLSVKGLEIPDFNQNFDAMISWVINEYIPKEPSVLSPGVMSNAPDRFDGFHSFNRCCRGKADKGRHTNNLKSYTTDRRVFEFWSEGDWIAADRLMGLVKSKLMNEPCFDGGDGPPTADHIGPLSLGFCHHPKFKLLSKSANSAKNNRMTLLDVQCLLSYESRGHQIISWYAKPLWDLRKHDVNNDEKSLRLSKMLRDNQRNAMYILCKIFDAKKYAFLVYLLELKYADRKIEFRNLCSVDFFTVYDHIIEEPRTTKYSSEQKSRRIRIGFDALKDYNHKENRHQFTVAKSKVDNLINKAIDLLDNIPDDLKKIEEDLNRIFLEEAVFTSEQKLRDLSQKFPLGSIDVFEGAKAVLVKAMEEVGNSLSSMWSDDRFTRE